MKNPLKKLWISAKKKWLIYVVGGFARRRRPPSDPGRKILVIQLASIGDAATLIPVCDAVRQQGWQLDFVCPSGVAPLWREYFPQSAVYALSRSDWSAVEEFRSFSDLRQKQYRAVVVTSITPVAALLASKVSATVRLGMAECPRPFKGARWLLDDIYCAHPQEHVQRRYRGLFELLVPALSRVKINRNGHFAAPGSDYVLLHPGAKWKPRRWPAERFLAVARELLRRGTPVKILIHEKEEDLLHFFRSDGLSKDQLIVSRSAEDLIGAVRNAGLLVGNDSGPAHLANLMEKPTIVLWGPGDYHRIRPIGENVHILIKEIACRPCRQYRNGDRCELGDNLCLKLISVQEVLDKIDEVLKTADVDFPEKRKG